ncbi:M61 family metallopeptidase [Dyella psychrodurans]|uniref:M61 family peptidase n=1 Tax=Dyella psychrodurans TaxID=1927960 RepID=A0A370XCJ7_9GAMM|nr:M61 family metallopeptidase [Dyella psychrodurans]RDS86163.1 M61 family peptidase [Dyella psychrodurans]
MPQKPVFGVPAMPANQTLNLRLRVGLTTLALAAMMAGTAVAQVGSGPMALPAPPALPTPADRPFHGTIQLAVNATDTDHQIFSVRETIPVQTPGDTVLLYPEWETASHAPTATVAELAGLMVNIDGKPSEWTRDPVDMHAFHVDVPKGATSITVEFQFLAPAAADLLRPDMVEVPWQRVLLYPAGWYVRDIPVAATLMLPRGITPYTALVFQTIDDGTLGFQPVTLEQLIDAPVYAGRFTRRILLNEDNAKPIALDLLADAKEDLAITQPEVERMKALIAQSLKTFGTAPYRHYDAIVTLSDVLSPDGGGGGVEHLEEGENNLPAAYFTHAAEQLNNLDLIAHEFAHAWNGRWREPADLWSPTFNQPISGSLLWVYEGQTEFWGRVLAARAGLRDHRQTLDKLALDAATVANRTGRRWKDLQDSTNDAVYMAKHHVAWRDWQRREDYYPEGVLLWLDVDARLRELSRGEHGLDDFARLFFDAKESGQPSTRTYTFQDVCDALNKVAPDDWAAFLNRHLQSHSADDAIAGLARAGWKLTYSGVPTETFLQDEAEQGAADLDYSIGLQVDTHGRVQSVRWDSPAFRAGLSPGSQVTEVDGEPFSTRALIAAVQSSASKPLTLMADVGGAARTVVISYREGLRYPHLERISGTPDRLSALLTAQ